MISASYSDSITEFLQTSNETILGCLTKHDEFGVTEAQKQAWLEEIRVLKNNLSQCSSGDIIFEYTVPRLGSRIDVVILIQGVIILIEFKCGAAEYFRSARDQVMDYALDLKYFHEESQKRCIIPILTATKASARCMELSFLEDNIADVIYCNEHNLGTAVQMICQEKTKGQEELLRKNWIESRYAPTPTIIEAAQELYRNHSVKDISRNDAGAHNLTITTEKINQIINETKRMKCKSICFVTGVPGAGKTLAGLNIASMRQNMEQEERAVFLSGNGPLVDVLQEALARDEHVHKGIPIGEARRKVRSFIQIVHKFRDDCLRSTKPPIEKIAIFDEAQRAWDLEALKNFMEQKKGRPNFNQSEADFLISILNRHSDWAVIICLIGGGQEIYKGEAGMTEWFKAIKQRYKDWHVFVSDQLQDTEYVGGSSQILKQLETCRYHIVPELHLGVSLRSFRNENLAEFIKLMLDNRPESAKILYQQLKNSYPIFLTRNLKTAKKWCRQKARGNERYGLIASSGGKRLRAQGIWVPTQINHVKWFLNGKEDVDSSYHLEVAASEFKIQGLEIDYALVAWDADFRYENGTFSCYVFRTQTSQAIKTCHS
jgi:hypothetical protein